MLKYYNSITRKINLNGYSSFFIVFNFKSSIIFEFDLKRERSPDLVGSVFNHFYFTLMICSDWNKCIKFKPIYNLLCCPFIRKFIQHSHCLIVFYYFTMNSNNLSFFGNVWDLILRFFHLHLWHCATVKNKNTI